MQSEGRGGLTDDTRAMTSEKVLDSAYGTEVRLRKRGRQERGTVRNVATQAEVNARSDRDSKIVTPATLPEPSSAVAERFGSN